MSTQPKAGEMLVGAYHKFLGECDFVTYQKTSLEKDMVMNDDYAERIQDLRELAPSKNTQTNDLAFHFLLIFECLS